MYEMFQAFDLPDPSTPNGDRNSTVVAPQALFMMNCVADAEAYAERWRTELLAAAGVDDAARIREAYERALARPPRASDVDRALTFIAHVEKAMEENETTRPTALFAWQSFCKALLASNEFIYLN